MHVYFCPEILVVSLSFHIICSQFAFNFTKAIIGEYTVHMSTRHYPFCAVALSICEVTFVNMYFYGKIEITKMYI